MNAIDVRNTKITCDTEGCDFEEPCGEDPKEWLNKPCPKCSANLLTQENYDSIMEIMKYVEMINNMELPEEVKDSENPERIELNFKVGPDGKIVQKEISHD